MAAIGGVLMGDMQPLRELIGVGKPWPTMDQVRANSKNMTEEQKRAARQEAFNVAMDINNPMNTIGGLLGTIKHIKNVPNFYQDVPSESWLQDQIDYAVSKGVNEYGVPAMYKNTARFEEPVRLPVSVLRKFKGQRGEQSNVRQESLDYLKNVMKDTGKLPLSERGREYAPYIEVGYDGIPWVSEGNHRIMAADQLGWKDLPVEIRYFEGGEMVPGELNPETLMKYLNVD